MHCAFPPLPYTDLLYQSGKMKIILRKYVIIWIMNMVLEVWLCSVFKLLKVIQTDILKGKQPFETRCALYVNQTSLQYLYSMLSVCLIRGKRGKDKHKCFRRHWNKKNYVYLNAWEKHIYCRNWFFHNQKILLPVYNSISFSNTKVLWPLNLVGCLQVNSNTIQLCFFLLLRI